MLTDNWNIYLEELSKYPDNWDSEGAEAIKPETITNCRYILIKTEGIVEFLDDIYPTEFGTICIQFYNSKTDILCNVEVAPDRIAYYCDNPEDKLISIKPTAFNDEVCNKMITTFTDSLKR